MPHLCQSKSAFYKLQRKVVFQYVVLCFSGHTLIFHTFSGTVLLPNYVYAYWMLQCGSAG